MSPVLALAACFSERIRINSITSEIRDGRRFWLKRRCRSAPFIMACANGFFRLAGNPVHALAEVRAWQKWEVDCFLQLHGEQFRAFADGECVVAAEEMPGESLAHFLDPGNLTQPMAAAAGRELRRAHEMDCPVLGGRWSHGDPHAGNFLYDETTDRARLIDFEVMHTAALSEEERHADDLLVFLQDVVGRVPVETWLRLALAFLDAYGRPEINARLVPRLILPRGIPRLWWAVRTTYLPGSELANRLDLLREALIQRGTPAPR